MAWGPLAVMCQGQRGQLGLRGSLVLEERLGERGCLCSEVHVGRGTGARSAPARLPLFIPVSV